MLALTIALLILYAFFSPVTVNAELHHCVVTQVRFSVQFACFTKTWRIRGFSGAATQLRQSRSRTLLNLFRRADKARKFLLRHIRLGGLDALVLLRTEDAARSALLSGALKSVLVCIPAVRRQKARIQVLPEFFRAHSTVCARCIIRPRMGIIILTAILLLAAYIREQQKMKARHAYGTSHW